MAQTTENPFRTPPPIIVLTGRLSRVAGRRARRREATTASVPFEVFDLGIPPIYVVAKHPDSVFGIGELIRNVPSLKDPEASDMPFYERHDSVFDLLRRLGAKRNPKGKPRRTPTTERRDRLQEIVSHAKHAAQQLVIAGSEHLRDPPAGFPILGNERPFFVQPLGFLAVASRLMLRLAHMEDQNVQTSLLRQLHLCGQLTLVRIALDEHATDLHVFRRSYVNQGPIFEQMAATLDTLQEQTADVIPNECAWGRGIHHAAKNLNGYVHHKHLPSVAPHLRALQENLDRVASTIIFTV